MTLQEQLRKRFITEKSAAFSFFFFVLFGMVEVADQVDFDHSPANEQRLDSRHSTGGYGGEFVLKRKESRSWIAIRTYTTQHRGTKTFRPTGTGADRGVGRYPGFSGDRHNDFGPDQTILCFGTARLYNTTAVHTSPT